MMVSTQEDEFTREKWLNEARWTALLSNGQTVIQDDGRPGADPASAWLRLGMYVTEMNLKIVGLTLQFRSELPLHMPKDAEGYFFRKSMGAFLNTGQTFGFYLIGHLANGVIHVRQYKVPEMILVETTTRDPDDPKKVGPSLIRNNKS